MSSLRNHFERIDGVRRYIGEHSDEPLTRVNLAAVAGYDTHAAFSKAFRQQFGISASESRQLDCRAATQMLTKGETT